MTGAREFFCAEIARRTNISNFAETSSALKTSRTGASYTVVGVSFLGRSRAAVFVFVQSNVICEWVVAT